MWRNDRQELDDSGDIARLVDLDSLELKNVLPSLSSHTNNVDQNTVNYDDESDKNSVDDHLLPSENHENAFKHRPRKYSRRKCSQLLRLRKRTIACICIIIFIIIVSITALKSPKKRVIPPPGPYWKGFKKIENWFAFGDCWTSTEGPRASSYLGINASAFPGNSISSTPTYMHYLTLQYNQSAFKSWNLARGGAVVDTKYRPSFASDFAHQLDEDFIVEYISYRTGIFMRKSWLPETTIVSTFFGINDVILEFISKSRLPMDNVFSSYESFADKLYDAGAKNFLFINVPPLHLGPGYDKKDSKQMGRNIIDFNAQIPMMVDRLWAKHKNITIFEFDMYNWFQQVMEDPKGIIQTEGLKNLDGVCYNYVLKPWGEQPSAADVAACGGLRPDEYLWKDGGHVMQPLHDALADTLSLFLMTNGTRWT